jgi:hypothetical protein
LKAFSLSVGLLALGSIASADSIAVQLGAGSLAITGAGVPDTVLDTGANTLSNLTLGIAQNVTFYTPLYNAFCTTCSGTFSGNLTGALIVSDSTVNGSGTGNFSQNFTDSIPAAGGNHTFTPNASSAISVNLSNGDTLTITPLQGSGVVVATNATNNSTTVSATFLLSKTAPEPSSALLLLAGLPAAGLIFRKSRKVL